MNLQETIDCLLELYGARNGMFLQGGPKRGELLRRGLVSLLKAVRANRPESEVATILASVFSRAVALGDSYINLPLVHYLCSKYPATHCHYCGSMPCGCSYSREKNINHLCKVSSDQTRWSISEWIAHLDALYGENNRARGVDKALLRLIEEVFEAESAHLFDDITDESITVSARRHKIALECADIFAWIFSIAGMLNLSLQQMVEERYGGVCRRCQQRPCDCGNPLYQKIRANPKSADTRSI